jgi:hypothetical protein
LTYARGAKFVNELRVVYEIQSRLEPEPKPEQVPARPKHEPKPDPHYPQQKSETHPGRHEARATTLLAFLAPSGPNGSPR